MIISGPNAGGKSVALKTVGVLMYMFQCGLRVSMGYTGCAKIADMKDNAQFVRMTGAGFKESHAHNISITREAPNYRTENN